MSVLALEKVNYAYEKAVRKLLENVSIEFEAGRFYAILGGSGAGKSTLLGLLAGLDVPTGGRILCNGKDILEEGLPRHRKRNVSLVFQNYNLIDYLTPLENLRLVKRDADAKVLETMGLEKEEINRNVMKLSGGQQQRVAIGRALVSDAPIILADEPTGNLDPETSVGIMKLLDRINRTETTVIMATHDSSIVDQMRRRVLELRKGELVRDQAKGVYGVN